MNVYLLICIQYHCYYQNQKNHDEKYINGQNIKPV
jgi:hypothetical protein